MAVIAVTRLDVRPLPGATIESFPVTGTVYVGDPVYTVGGSVAQGNGAATATAYARGIVVAAPDGGTKAITGDRVDVVTWGRVTGFTGATAEMTAYSGGTAGDITTASITVSHKIGVFRNATVLFVQPELH